MTSTKAIRSTKDILTNNRIADSPLNKNKTMINENLQKNKEIWQYSKEPKRYVIKYGNK